MAIGQYDNLGPVFLPMNMDGFALILAKADHGVHRFLSALIRIKKQFKVSDDCEQLLAEIECLLEGDDVCKLEDCGHLQLEA